MTAATLLDTLDEAAAELSGFTDHADAAVLDAIAAKLTRAAGHATDVETAVRVRAIAAGPTDAAALLRQEASR